MLWKTAARSRAQLRPTLHPKSNTNKSSRVSKAKAGEEKEDTRRREKQEMLARKKNRQEISPEPCSLYTARSKAEAARNGQERCDFRAADR